MNDDQQGRPKRRKRLWWALAALLVIVALLVVPPLIGINHYKARITQLISASVGRPVRLSAVEMRLLPRPAFVITDLTVQEDPAFGAEPILHASSVTAAIRIASLWRGKLRVSSIAVDDASFNLVRLPDGRWNLDSLFQTAGPGAAQQNAGEPPYMSATSSRINIKNGIEKLPFSLLGADASMWQESSGDWRVRLRGQPARTDVTLDLADTGIVRLEATIHPASQLNRSAVLADVDWREAQLGQLTRLVLGSDEGWRGNLTGQLHVEGTASEANVRARLQATGVRREEFVPAAPIDFDATCAFVYRYGQRRLENLACDSPIGDGRARLTGNIPGGDQPLRMALELDRIPAQAALDALRTVRRKIDPSIQAQGSISGRLAYNPGAANPPVPAPAARTQRHPAEPRPLPGTLTGALSVDALRISGDALSRPIQLAKMTLEPAPAANGQPQALITTVAVPAGAPAPLSLCARLALTSFQVNIRGSAAIARLREFARVSGYSAGPVLDQLAGEPAILDLTAEGPWLTPFAVAFAATTGPAPVAPDSSFHANGTITLRDANWKPGFLANAVLISSATLHMENGALRWDPVVFSYGPVKGAATLDLPSECDKPETCAPRFTVRFGSLDTAELESALLGARESGTLLSTLLARLNPSRPPSWPRMEGTAQADTLIAGPFTLTNVAASVRVLPNGAEFTSIDGAILGGQIHGSGSLETGDKPAYKLDAKFKGIKPAQVGQLTPMKWTGSDLSGDGHLEFSGYTDKDLSGSANGTIHFAWNHGSLNPPAGTEPFPPALSRFDRWTGDAKIAGGELRLGQNQVQRGSRKSSIPEAMITFAIPARVSFGAPQEEPKAPAAKQ